MKTLAPRGVNLGRSGLAKLPEHPIFAPRPKAQVRLSPQTGKPLKSSVYQPAAKVQRRRTAKDLTGRTIGPYKVLRSVFLGEGVRLHWACTYEGRGVYLVRADRLRALAQDIDRHSEETSVNSPPDKPVRRPGRPRALTVEQVHEMRKQAQEGAYFQALAKRFSVSEMVARNAVYGQGGYADIPGALVRRRSAPLGDFLPSIQPPQYLDYTPDAEEIQDMRDDHAANPDGTGSVDALSREYRIAPYQVRLYLGL